MGIKQTVKNVVPAGVWQHLQRLKGTHEVNTYYRDQRKRFIRYCAAPWNDGEAQLQGKMMFFVHRVEKGLSHKNFRIGFGKAALTELSEGMREWRRKGYSLDNPMYKAAQDVVKAYVRKHDELGAQVPSFVDDLFGELPQAERKEPAKPLSAGAQIVTAAEKKNNAHADYATLFRGRTSVREFSGDPVDVNKVKSAIDLSMKTPSVCNRQSYRVLLVENKELIGKALQLQGGWRGYESPSVLALVTADLRSFVSMEERNEPYIDGGLFTMAFLTALEYEGLGACPLNTMHKTNQEQAIRSLLQIPDYEVLIAFISIGNIPESIESPVSMRYSGASITRELI